MNATTPTLTPLALQNEDVLRWLAANGRPDSKAALARALGRDQSNLGKSLDAMVRDGLLDKDLEFLTPGVSALAALDRANGRAGGDLTAPWSAFKPHPLNPRKAFDPDALDELGADILARGQDQNIVCRAPGDDGVLFIRSGERRWRAIGRRIEAGEASQDFPIRYIVRDEDDEAHLLGALGENIQRAALNPIEEATALQYMRDTLGLSTGDIAKRINKGQRFVQLRLQLLTAPEITQVALREGKITVQEALAAVQQAKPKAVEPNDWVPNAEQVLVMVEIAHFVGGEIRSLRSADCPGSATFPQPWPSDAGAYAGHNTNGVEWSSTLHVGSLLDDRLTALGLHPLTDPTALFRARQQAGMGTERIRTMEVDGRYATSFLNPRPTPVPPEASAPRVEADVEPASTRTLADQVREALDDDEDEDDTLDMFPGAPREQPPEAAAPTADTKPVRNAYEHARKIADRAYSAAGDFLVQIEHDGDFDWAKADCPTLAAKLTYYLTHGSVLGVMAVGAALYARGGDMFSEKALVGAWDQLRRQALSDAAFAPELDRPVKLAFDLSATGEIVDAQDGGLIAETAEEVSLEDAAAMAAGPELLRALRGVLAVAPLFSPDDDDVQAETAWRFAGEVAALATKLGDQ